MLLVLKKMECSNCSEKLFNIFWWICHIVLITFAVLGRYFISCAKFLPHTFCLTLGETGSGKSTLINCLFNTSLDESMSTHFHPNVRLKAQRYELHESNVRLKLTVVSTVGFGDQINKEDR